MEFRKKECVVPSGRTYVIREQNGHDDEVLSQIGTSDEWDVINRFMSNIVLHQLVEGHETPVGYNEVLEMPLRDKYALLIMSRIFSLGEELTFEYDWGSNVPPQSYLETLNQFIWDYSKPMPEPSSIEYFRERIPAYDPQVLNGMYFSVGGRELRMKLLDGKGEKYLLKIPPSQVNINQELFAREISYKEGDKWLAIKNFGSFTARDMAAIRAMIRKYDDRVETLVTVDHPFTGETAQIPLIGIRDFFFPALL